MAILTTTKPPTAVTPPAVAPPPTAPVGGSWGGTLPRPPITHYPTAAQQAALNAQNMPGAWGNWFAQTVAPLADYYTPERGGAPQAARDWQNFSYYWQQRTGRPITAEDLSRFMVGFQGYASQLGRPALLADIYDYAAQALAAPVKPPLVSYLKVGEF